MNLLSDILHEAARFIRNPLGIFALTTVVGLVASVYVIGNVQNHTLQGILACCFFVILTILIFVLRDLIINHYHKFYSPSDFSKDESFLALNDRVENVENLTARIREEVEGLPMFKFARLSVSVQSFLKSIYAKEVNEVDLRTRLDNAATLSPEEIEVELSRLIEDLKSTYGWLEIDGSMVRLSTKGKEELDSFIELTIPRWMQYMGP